MLLNAEEGSNRAFFPEKKVGRYVSRTTTSLQPKKIIYFCRCLMLTDAFAQYFQGIRLFDREHCLEILLNIFVVVIVDFKND